MKQVGIITEDIVFYSIIVTLMRRFDKSLSVEHFSSYKTILDSKTLDKKDVFIIDGIMSGTASLEEVSYLRRNKELTAPILYVSPINESHLTARIKDAGINKFYSKPFDPNEVITDLMKFISE